MAFIGPVVATEQDCSVITAPVEITTPGCYTLDRDLIDSNASTAVNITASNVVFDGMDYTLDSDNEGQYGVRVGSTGSVTNVTIRNVTITDFENGIYFENTNESEIRGTYITTDSNLGGADWAISLEGSGDNTIVNNTIFGTDLSIKIDAESPRNVVTNNSIKNTILTLSDETIIENNEISGATNIGVEVEGEFPDPIEGTVIQNNVVSYSGDAGIYIDYANATSVLDNELRNNGVGISTDGRTPNTVIRNTTSVDNGADVKADRTNGYPEPTLFQGLDIGTAVFSDVTLSDIELSGTSISSSPESVETLGINFTATDIHEDAYSEPEGYLDIDLQYKVADVAGVNESTVALYRYDEQSDTWADEGATLDTASNTVSANLTSIRSEGSTFTIAAEEAETSTTISQIDGNTYDILVENAVGDLDVPISLGETDAGNATGVQYDELNIATTRDATYNLTFETNETVFATATALTAKTPLLYANITHPDLTDDDIDRVVFTVSVDNGSLPSGMDASNVSIYRYDGNWNELSTTQVGQIGDNYELQATSPGLSVFAVGVDESPTEPQIAVSPSSIDFGTVDVGTTANEIVTVSNTGDGDLSVTDVSLNGTDADEFGESENEFTLAPGDTRDLRISFSPTADGSKNANLVIESNDRNTPTLHTLTGTAENIAGTGVRTCEVIDSPGRYQLQNDISNAIDQYCFEITTSDVILDGNSHIVDGTAIGDSSAVFVNGTAAPLTNVTVKDLNVTQFDRGVTATNAEVDVRGLTGLPNTGVQTYGTDLKLENSALRAGAGVVAESWKGRVSNSTLEAVTIESFRGGYVDEGTLSINNSTLRQPDVTDNGIKLLNATLDISNTTIESSNERMGVGVLAEDNSTVNASHSTFTNTSEGIQLTDSEGTITYSTIENPGKNGLNYTRSTGVASFNTITNSSRADNYRWAGGIYAFESEVTTSDNTVIGGSERGILLHNSDGLVHNNTVRDTAGWEVALVSSHGNVTNNTVDGPIVVFGNTVGENDDPVATANVTHNTVTSPRNWGVLVDANAQALVAHNNISALTGVELSRGAGADVRHNIIREQKAPAYQSFPSAGVQIDDTHDTLSSLSPRSVLVRYNDINATTGVYATETAGLNFQAVLNDLSATEVALRNDNTTASVFFSQLNYYGPNGPADGRIVGNWDNVEPFLTDPSGMDDYESTQTTQAFGYDFEFDAGGQYAFGTPGTLSANLSTMFGDFDGAIYLYDSASDSWTLATGDEVLGPMEAVVVVPTTDTRAVVDFADATPALATSRQLDTTGWHFVAPRMHTNAEEAFSTRTVGVTDLLATFDEPTDLDPWSAADSFGRYTFSSDRTSQGNSAPTVNPFTGYFVYVDDPGTIPGAVPDGVRYPDLETILIGGD